ncbi:MAG: hypothetical protein SGPRY_006748 [Prymnesium sp.]
MYGYIDVFALNYFLRDIVQGLLDAGDDPPLLETMIDEMIDLAKLRAPRGGMVELAPQPEGSLPRISHRELVASGAGSIVVSCLTDTQGFWNWDNRESLIEGDDDDRYAREKEEEGRVVTSLFSQAARAVTPPHVGEREGGNESQRLRGGRTMQALLRRATLLTGEAGREGWGAGREGRDGSGRGSGVGRGEEKWERRGHGRTGEIGEGRGGRGGREQGLAVRRGEEKWEERTEKREEGRGEASMEVRGEGGGEGRGEEREERGSGVGRCVEAAAAPSCSEGMSILSARSEKEDMASPHTKDKPSSSRRKPIIPSNPNIPPVRLPPPTESFGALGSSPSPPPLHRGSSTTPPPLPRGSSSMPLANSPMSGTTTLDSGRTVGRAWEEKRSTARGLVTLNGLRVDDVLLWLQTSAFKKRMPLDNPHSKDLPRRQSHQLQIIEEVRMIEAKTRASTADAQVLDPMGA